MSPPSRFWAHAAAFGALWGAAEVTLGSFLHALRLPVAGLLLSTAGASLLVAEAQLLPRRGLLLATGLVAALCKALSPSGIILGPMLGIAVEACLVELLLLRSPRWLVGPSAALAVTVAGSWALLQKLATQLLLYGTRILDLYAALLAELGRALGLPAAWGWRLLSVAVLLLLALGTAGGLLGLRAGREARRRLEAAA